MMCETDWRSRTPGAHESEREREGDEGGEDPCSTNSPSNRTSDPPRYLPRLRLARVLVPNPVGLHRRVAAAGRRVECGSAQGDGERHALPKHPRRQCLHAEVEQKDLDDC